MAILLRTDFDASQVRAATKAVKDGPQVRRLLALAAIYDGSVDQLLRKRMARSENTGENLPISGEKS